MQSSYQLYKKQIIASLLLISIVGCKKLVEVSAPVTSTNSANVYTTDATAIAVLTDIYAQMSGSSITNGGVTSMSFLPGLSADEFTLYSGVGSTTFSAYYMNALSTVTGGDEFWVGIYPTIFKANAAIEGLSGSSDLTLAVQQQLLGEAKFIRAFHYFYLVNLYGDVPLAVTSDYKVNAVLNRTPKAEVWQQIIADLQDAKRLLNANYLDATLLNTTSERVRPTTWAATALLARSYLYTQQWDSAEAQATSVINNTNLFSLDSLNGVFLANSTEAIWQLQAVNVGYNTQDAQVFIIPSTGPSSFNPVYLSDTLLNKFEVGDQRKVNWIGNVTPIPPGNDTFYFPFKYQANTTGGSASEYAMVLRLGEQFLIRAEARAQLGESNAGADLNVIRERAGLQDYTNPIDKTSLLAAILHERQVELFSEWGHRWLDLKRTGSVDELMTLVTPQKGGTWNTIQQLYPLPLTDLEYDPNLAQNPGY